MSPCRARSLVVVLANFYDVLIDCPTSFDLFKDLLVEWEQATLVKKELEDKCLQHVDSLKKQLEAEYKAKP